MATVMINGGSGTEGNIMAVSASNTGKQQSKTAFGNKNGDGSRKQPANLNDPIRRNIPPKAWTSGMNPITQRSNTPAQQNGVAPQIKVSPLRNNSNAETNTFDRHANDRLLCLLGNFLGISVTITVKNGDMFSGIFCGAILEYQHAAYLLKMVQQISMRVGINGSREGLEEYIGTGEDHAMSFNIKDVIDLAAEGVTINYREKALNGAIPGFRTDADISGNQALRERSLQRWEPSVGGSIDLSLEQSPGAWDQFQANEQKFGLRSDYDESLYTTAIDRSDPLYHQREAEAQRIAEEIQGSLTDNLHVKEERGMTNEDDGQDEEEKFSGVHRYPSDLPPLSLGQGNKYMPPARRPTAKSVITGAPMDPAIISSQIARPDGIPQDRHKEMQPASDNNPPKSEEAAIKRPRETAVKDTKDVVTSNQHLATPLKTQGSSISATANVETEVLDSFRQFASFEKMRVSDHRRQRVSHDKAIKLNDLMKFSKNFKLLTPVPKDLVPILAKDKSKQEEIMEKAQRNAQSSNASQRLASTSLDQKASRPLAEAKYDGQKISPNASENHEARSPYSSHAPQGSLVAKERQQPSGNTSLPSPKSGQGLLGHRLADNRRMHQAGLPINVPQPLPIQTGPKVAIRTTINPPVANSQSPSSARTPTSAASAKFNVKAIEFRPNPAANSFKPTGNPSTSSSPKSTPNARPASRAPSPSAFFGSRKPLLSSERSSILDNFNPLKRLKEKAEAEGKSKDYSSNGGITYAYTTPPTWKAYIEGEAEKSYKDILEDLPPVPSRTSPHQVSPVNAPLPHQHQLPLHLQHPSHGVPHLQPPQQAPYPIQPQVQHYSNPQHYHDDHRMHLSASSSSVYPSPRLQNTTMAYPSPMAQPAQIPYGQPLPQYVMGINGPHPTHLRQFAPSPQIVPGQGPQIAAPMMVQQSSQGGFVAPSHSVGVPFNPQIPMYASGQPPAFNSQSQQPSGYPSPGRAAPMMMQQGSHQGSHQGPHPAQQPPPHMMPMRGYSSPQPHYNHSPQQQYHYPSQPHRVQGNGYSQPHHQHAVSQHPPLPAIPVEGSEEIK